MTLLQEEKSLEESATGRKLVTVKAEGLGNRDYWLISFRKVFSLVHEIQVILSKSVNLI